MNLTIASRRDPKANDPKWYLNALYTDLPTGIVNNWPDPYEKYQIAAAEAITN